MTTFAAPSGRAFLADLKTLESRPRTVPPCHNGGIPHRADGLHAVFRIKPGRVGDETLEDARGGYFGGFSIEFSDARRRLDSTGVSEVREAHLLACTLVGTPAYQRATISDAPELVGARRASFPSLPPRPVVNLEPIEIRDRWGWRIV